MNIYLDIETIPTTNPAILADLSAEQSEKLAADIAAVKAPSNYKDEAKIAEYIAKAKAELIESSDAKLAETIAKTSFDGAAGQICCIGFAFADLPATTLSAIFPASESEIITQFFSAVTTMMDYNTRPTIIGHNVHGFDLRFLWQRSIVNGIKPPLMLPWHAKPWSEHIADTILMWNPDPGKRISLDRLCRALGVTSPKGEFDGSMVAAAYAAGEYQKIADYCKADVEATRACYRRMS